MFIQLLLTTFENLEAICLRSSACLSHKRIA